MGARPHGDTLAVGAAGQVDAAGSGAIQLLFGGPEGLRSAGARTLTLDAARWIAERRIGLLGMDTPTPSTDWKECHHILLKKGVEIVIVEALTNLEKLPAQFTFIGFPLNIKGRDGAPIRAVALLD